MMLDQSDEVVPRSELAGHEGRQGILGNLDHLAKTRAVEIAQRARSGQKSPPRFHESFFRDAVRAQQLEGNRRSSVVGIGIVREVREIGFGDPTRPEETIHHVLPQTKRRRHDGLL